MTKTRYYHDTLTNEWVFPNGKRLPVISGGDPTATVTIEGEPAPVITQGQQQQAGDNVFTQADVIAAIEKAREQEKNKLYPRLEALGEQLNTLQQERDAQAEAARQAQEAADAERKRQEEAELSSKELLTVKESEWQQQITNVKTEAEQRIEALAAELAAHKAALAKEQEFQALSSFKARRLAEESENIYPGLADLVTGNTEQEIEESIAVMVAKSAQLVGSIQQVGGAGQPLRPKGISPTGGVPSGPLENSTENQTLTMADIANMSMQEYAKVRDRLLAAGSRR